VSWSELGWSVASGRHKGPCIYVGYGACDDDVGQIPSQSQRVTIHWDLGNQWKCGSEEVNDVIEVKSE